MGSSWFLDLEDALKSVAAICTGCINRTGAHRAVMLSKQFFVK